MLRKRTGENRILTDICNWGEWGVVIFSTLIISFLAFVVFQYYFNSENSIPLKSNILVHVILCVMLIAGCKGLGYWLNKHTRVGNVISAIFFVITIGFVGCVCISYVTQALLLPGSDEKACFDIALRFLQSEFGAVVPQGSYLSLWPYQTGLIFITEKMMRLFGTQNPIFFQYINCFYILIIISAGYSIISMHTKKVEGRLIYLLLMGTYWPLLFRVSRVYGDLPGLTWMMFSITCYMFYFKTSKRGLRISAMIGFICSTVLACTYKGNCLIYIIALILVTILQQLRKFNLGFLAVVAGTVIVSIFSTSITQKYYEYYAENTCGDGMPAVGWIAMGLQYNGEDAIPGGWNGFHSNAFISSGYSYEKTVAVSLESIQNSLESFSSNPDFACEFFFNKLMKQWANQTHGVWWGTNGYYDVSRDDNSFWVQFLNNMQYNELLGFMDYHETIIYGILLGACVCLFHTKMKRKKIDVYVLLPIVTFIGGFLFSIIWEAQTSTVMSYPILMLPIAIVLITELNIFDITPFISFFNKRIRTQRISHSKL